MTFSIVAADLERGDWGVAVASKFPAVGAVVPWVRARAGAIATQALANADYGPEGLGLLADGRSADDTLATLVGADEGRDQRQAGIVDSKATAATYTGAKCINWAGGMTGDGFACQGNILTGPEVLDAMSEAYASTDGEVVDKLLAALQAGDQAGGDRRGKQSAAVVVAREGGGYGGRSDRYVDLRVDDHPEPVMELLRIFSVYDREYLIRNDPLLPANPELVSEIQRRLLATRHYDGEVTGALDPPTRKALEDFAGELNLEGKIREDDRVYESLIRELRDVTPESSE